MVGLKRRKRSKTKFSPDFYVRAGTQKNESTHIGGLVIVQRAPNKHTIDGMPPFFLHLYVSCSRSIDGGTLGHVVQGSWLFFE